jgi:transposase
MFNKKLKNRIAQLEDQLKEQSTYIVVNPYEGKQWHRETLLALEIIERFDELYEHLGIERQEIPAVNKKSRLVKIKRSHD